jgi:hypothetical protein
MDSSEFNFVRLTSGHQLKPFNCNDSDLNDFFFNDAKNYQEGLLAVTYIIETKDIYRNKLDNVVRIVINI